MARNSKRNAFTIVELVIVIAVIAILSTVLITTFTGVIESANVSADKQLLSTLNTQISMHIGKGNDIDTVDDLKTALNTQDINYWEKLDPKSAQYGYHYWYDSAKQQIVLEKFGSEALKKAFIAEPIGRFLGGVSFAPRAVDNSFEAASPRSINGYYFLDQQGKNANKLAESFYLIENMGKGDNYKSALGILEDVDGKNGDLATAILGKISQTAIITDQGIFVNVSDKPNENVITNIYIPENVDKKEEYYLNSQFTDKNGNAVDKDTFTYSIGTSVTLPENIKVGEGALNDFGEININVNITADADKLADAFKEIFSAESVNGNIIVNGNINVTIEGSKVTGDIDVTLTYNNPVTGEFVASATAPFMDGKYIALHKIQEDGFKINLGSVDPLKGADGKDAYNQTLKWEIVEEGSNISSSDVNIENGVLTFKEGFSGSTIKLKATPVAVNDSDNAPTSEIELVVVKLNKVDLTFNGAKFDLATGSANPLFVDYNTKANTFKDFAYTYVINDGKNTVVSGLNTEALGYPSVEVISGNATHFNVISVDGVHTLDFAWNSVKATILKNGVTSDKVTIKVSNAKGVLFTNDFVVNVEPSLFETAIPEYKPGINMVVNPEDKTDKEFVDHVYTIGDKNAITLGVLFKQSDLFAGETIASSAVVVKAYNAVKMGDGVPANAVEKTITFNKTGDDWTKFTIQLTDPDINLIEIGNGKERARVWVNVVDGKNIFNPETAMTEFMGDPTNNYNGTDGIVLHCDVKGFTPNDGFILRLTNKSIYGNYFTIDASKFKDNNADTANDGYGLIAMSGGSLNQVILKGPVFPTGAASDSLDNDGYFCFGVRITGASFTINDSYLFGFASPVFVNTTSTFNANNTIFEGGALANVYIRNIPGTVATTGGAINFNGVTTIQNRKTGYQATVGDTSKWSMGMGIFIHQDQKNPLALNMHDTEQYNWLSKADKDAKFTDGLINYIDMAIDEIFKGECVASHGWLGCFENSGKNCIYEYPYKEFWHNGDSYVNATLAIVNTPAKVTINATGTPSFTYDGKEGEEGSTLNIKIAVKTFKHSSSCTCSSDVNYTFGYDKFVEQVKY